MAILVEKNPKYGGTEVTTKYSPLILPAPNVANRSIYTGMLNNRGKMLNALGLPGQQLTLAVSPDWPTIVAAEDGHLPPLVVVSSNRAAWIRDGIACGTARLGILGKGAFANVSDMAALTGVQTISPPLYAPKRVNDALRNVYIVVHISEYANYRSKLAGTNITPVGWEFGRPAGARRNLAVVGFGATRFAAMEFCKTLRAAAAAAHEGAPWDMAWMMDDNTVALKSFPGFAAIENALGANVCAGFQGGTKAEAQYATKVMADNEVKGGRGQQSGPPAAPKSKGIIQQTVLWNVRYFDEEHLNFGPVFINSAEDLSITSYFDDKKIGYQFYSTISIVKENASLDGGSARKANKARQDLTAWVTDAESASPPTGTPPPPIMVEDANAGGQQTLSTFITLGVLPKAEGIDETARKNPTVQALAKSQGVEQITTGALAAGFVDDDAVGRTFKINGAASQAVTQKNVP